jgi:hypothetical protein
LDPKAINKAQHRLRVTQKALDDLSGARSYREFQDSWYVFLTASKSIYTVLQQGAKITPQSLQWFGGKSTERRNDPLLQYLYEARNEDEHGLDSCTELEPARIEIGQNTLGHSKAIRINGTDNFGNTFKNCFAIGESTAFSFSPEAIIGSSLKFEALDRKPIKTQLLPEHAILVAVHARGDRTYSPPTEHLGSVISDQSPIGVASLAMSYFQDLVAKAAQLR